MIRFAAILILSILSLIADAQSFDEVNNDIDISLSNSRWKTAEIAISYALRNFDLDESTTANMYHNLGYCKLQMKDYLEAKKYLQQAVDLKAEIYQRKSPDYAKTIQLLGDLSLEIGDYDRARDYLEEAHETIVSTIGKETDDYVESVLNLGQFYETLGNYRKAHKFFEEALEYSELIHHHESPDFANVLNHIGRIYVRHNEMDEAETYLIEANRIYHDLGTDYAIPYVESLENLAILYEHKGEFAQAEKLLLSIEREKRQIPNLPEELLLETLNDLGILYRDLNNVPKAKEYFEEVEFISRQHLGTEHQYYATAINNLAAISKDLGQYDEAQSLLVGALDIYKDVYGQIHPKYADALNNLASVERLKGDFDKSENHYKEVLEIDEVIYGKRHPNFATTVNNLGILYSSMGDHLLAGQYYQLATDIRKSTLGINHPSYARSIENMGLHFFALGDLEQAEKYLKEAVEIQIKQISTVFPALTEQERNLFYENIRTDIERYNFVAYKLLDTNPELVQDILNYQIASKGILFTSSERIRNAILNGHDPQLISDYTEWSDAKVRLVGYYQMGESRLERFGINLKSLENQIEAMEKELMHRSEMLAGLFQREEINWKDIRRAIHEDEALVEIVRFREFDSQISESTGHFGFSDKVHYMFIIVKPDAFLNPEYVVLDNGAALEEKGFSLYSNSVKFKMDLRASYINYWAEVDAKLDGVANVIISPDGVFHKLNPNVLMYSEGHYVLDKYFVTYTTNSRDVLKKEEHLAPGSKIAMLMGNPAFGKKEGGSYFELSDLPGAEKEINEIADLLKENGWQISEALSDEATEARLKSVHQPAILHLATHGYFSQENPVLNRITRGDNPMFKSGLFLNNAIRSYGNYEKGEFQDSRDDGILSAFEAMNLHLNNTRLVVLSACETGLGEIESGEGVYGLQRAISVAGAQNLITSITKVDDQATQYLMVHFYRAFLESDDVVQAFYKAQKELRKAYPDPGIWGAFIVTGKG